MKIKKITKNLLVTTSIAALIAAGTGNIAIAEEVKSEKNYIKSDFEVQLKAHAHFQSGYRNQSKLAKDEKNVSDNRSDFAFYNDAAFTLTGSKALDAVTYGAKIVLVPTAKRKGSGDFNGSHIFVESSFGKVELGSPLSAGSNMYTDGFDITAASGDWGRYADFTTNDMRQSEATKGKVVDGVVFTDGNNSAPAFIDYSEFFLDKKLVTKRDKFEISTEPSRAISYYTPKFNFGSSTSVQLGITYIPDSSNTGAGNPSSASSGKSIVELTADGKEAFEFDSSVKDALSGGVCLEQNFTDGVDLKIALTGEHGKAAGKATRKSTNTAIDGKEYKLKDLKTYNIGGTLNLGNFSVAGSYGSLGKSLTTPAYHKTGRDTTYYTGAVAYKYGPFNTSLAYFKSNQYKNTVDAISLGTDFKIAPGLKPYAEVSTFTLKGKPEFFPELQRKKTKGTVAILGLKLSL